MMKTHLIETNFECYDSFNFNKMIDYNENDDLCVQVVLLAQVVQFFLLLISLDALESLVGLVVENDKVAIANVETREMVARVFSIENVFVDYESCSSSFRRIA